MSDTRRKPCDATYLFHTPKGRWVEVQCIRFDHRGAHLFREEGWEGGWYPGDNSAWVRYWGGDWKGWT